MKPYQIRDKCPDCRQERLCIIKKKTRKNYPFGKYKKGWHNGKKSMIGKIKPRTSIVYMKIMCLNQRCDYSHKIINDYNWYSNCNDKWK